MAKTAYTPNKTPIRTPRSIEYDAFARVTRSLKSVSDGSATFPETAETLHRNRQLWTALASDVAESGNGLPEALRARIFYLAEFTVQHSRKVLRGEESAAVLVEINTAIMRGLRQTPEAR